MIRLEMTAVDKMTNMDGDGHPVTEINRQLLFAQEWQHGDGPDPTAIIALVNDLLRPVCQCGHRKTSHTTSYRADACAVAGCDCRGFQDPVAVAATRATQKQLELEKRISTYQAMEVAHGKQLVEANDRAASYARVMKTVDGRLKRSQATARRLREAAKPKRKR